MKRRDTVLLVSIVVLVGLCLAAIFPIQSNLLGPDGLRLGLDLSGGSQLLYKADLSKKEPTVSDEQAMASAIEKIQRRVNEFGAAEPTIQKQGTDRILVQLPGVKDITRAISLIGDTGLLYFRELEIDASGNPVVDSQGYYVFSEAAATAIGTDGEVRELTGQYLTSASPDFDQFGAPIVVFEWNNEGAHLFQQITSRNIQKPLAIAIDQEIISAPTVEAVISNRGQIQGDFTVEQTRDLVNKLNSGALDVPLELIDERDVDATLGADSVRKSLIAAGVGILLLLIFMVVYYRLPGAVACVSLLIYGAMLLAIFSTFSAQLTLTLPGIAAFILSLGMAVDANVLIFERLKEELRAGRTLQGAVEIGFTRAWSAIRDSNITTLIACVILFWLGGTFGAFMVRGFALTLSIGVAVSMFTAIVVSRTLLRIIVARKLVTDMRAYGVKL
ncbi:MAG: protein translocase subunit SecD [Dehalococcoidia bacterium]|nr:protein translocase subunit SecD [Dehalococcoidia bacterium]